LDVPFLWNRRSPSEPLSNNILFSFGLLTFLLLVLDFVYLDLLEDFFGRPDVVSIIALQRLLHLISAEGSLRLVCIDEYTTQQSLWG